MRINTVVNVERSMTRQKKQEDWIEAHYKTQEWGSICSARSAFGDAAALCDAMAEDILDAVKPKTKRKLAHAHELAARVKLAGDAIWAMRDKIKPSRDSGAKVND